MRLLVLGDFAEQEVHAKSDLVALEIEIGGTGENGATVCVEVEGLVRAEVMPVLQTEAGDLGKGPFDAAAAGPTEDDIFVLVLITIADGSFEEEAFEQEIGRCDVIVADLDIGPHRTARDVKQDRADCV